MEEKAEVWFYEQTVYRPTPLGRCGVCLGGKLCTKKDVDHLIKIFKGESIYTPFSETPSWVINSSNWMPK